MKHYHLSQVNIGRMKGPVDSAVMAEFVANLAPVNAIADQSPGFVWRLQTEGGDATAVRAFDDPLIIFNHSIWESVEALQNYVYKSGHTQFVRRRAEWFEKLEQHHMAMWWVPAGHIPTVAEACERLEFRRRHGDTPVAFSFAKRFPAPDEPAAAPAESTISYHDRRFALHLNSSGDGTAETRYHYRQAGSRVWGTYQGGDIRFGSLVAVTDASGTLDMRYQHVDSSDTFRTGICRTRPELIDGRLRLHETWHRTSDQISGESILEELSEPRQ